LGNNSRLLASFA